MEKINQKFYQKPEHTSWQGRDSDPSLGAQYWYQMVQCEDLLQIGNGASAVALLGYACDEGVKRNLGRAGAKEGPVAVRQQLARLANHLEEKVIDFGDIRCHGGDLVTTQKQLEIAVTELLSKKYFPIIMGGGHDIAFGHFNGIWNVVKETKKNKIGIINFDAHFDLRSPESGANSGTPFHQILSQHADRVSYYALGIQEASNTRQLFDIARRYGVYYALNTACKDYALEKLRTQLTVFIENVDWLYVTIDLDGFASAYAPGVSAPSPMGFTPIFAAEIMTFLIKTGKVISLDIAELNPRYDVDDGTARLAARLIDLVARLQDS